jgi:hypothetical protein
MKFLLWSVSLQILLSLVAIAQPYRTFQANDLPVAARELTGSDQNWPIVTALANYDAVTNQFRISNEAFARLAVFKTNWNDTQLNRRKYTELIRNGATVFAYNSLTKADSLWNQYRTHINAGNPDAADLTALAYRNAVQQMELDIRNFRITDVEARLIEASGIVQRRQGLIGSWTNVLNGALFKNADGIKTGERSSAKLNFVDGSDVILIENTTAIIRHANIDRLTNATDVEITINDGGLLARLSGAAIQGSNYVVNAGTASVQVRSTNFFTEVREDDTVIIANYTGSSVVTSEAVSVDLAENQGTVVVRGRQPSAPIQLLPAPRLPWVRADSVIIDQNLNLRWSPVDNAATYEIELASNASFDRDHIIHRTSQTAFNVDDIPIGTTFLRLRGIDRQGIRGNSSLTYRILRTQDVIPPAVILDNGNPQQIYTSFSRIRLTGFTEPGSRFLVNDLPITLSEDGRFQADILLPEERNVVRISSTDRAGNTTNDTRTVVKMSESRLFDLRWSVPISGETLSRAARIAVEGTAYEPVSVSITTSSSATYTARTGTTGRWALEFPVSAQDREIILTFTDRTTNQILFTRTYKLD